MWGSFPASVARNSVNFVSQVSLDSGVYASYGMSKRGIAVRGCRSVKKKDMKWNSSTPKVTVDPESYEVLADEELMDVAPVDQLPLCRAYNLF